MRLLDFGIAKLLADCGPLAASDVLTATGVRLGSALYMAPEQAAGDAVDAQADVWSMGIVLYECLTGVCPTRAGRGSAAIESLLPHVPEAIAALSASMLERDPIKRARGLKPLLDVLGPYADPATVARSTGLDARRRGCERRW